MRYGFGLLRRGSLLGALACLAALLLGGMSWSLLAAANADAATITIGSPLTASFTPGGIGPSLTQINSALPEAGANVASPVTGTVVRWRITGASGGPFKLRVLTPDGGTTYTGAGTSAPETPSSTATQTFTTSMPITAGQTIGIDNTNSSDQIGGALVTGAALTAWSPPLADGSTRAALGTVSGGELGFDADVQPLPTVTGVSPSSGPAAGGTTVTITGTNFDGTTAVSFGSKPAASFSVVSDTTLTAVAPAGSGTVDVTVSNPGQSAATAADKFTYTAGPPPVTPVCKVPKLKGKTLKAARKALKHAHCTLGKVKGPTSKTAKVTKQKPKPGSVLKAGSKVNVTTKL